MLEYSYGKQIQLSGTNGHFLVQLQYTGFPGAGDNASDRFDKMFEEVGVYSVPQLHFEHLYAAPRDMSLVERVWRQPKELRASVLLYMAVDAMDPLYLAMVKPCSDKEAYPADIPDTCKWQVAGSMEPGQAAKI